MRPLLIALSALSVAHADLTATFRSGDQTDTRRDRLPALWVGEGESPTPFLDAGPFEVTWTGKLALAERQRLHFSFEGEGEASLTIDGEEVFSEAGELGSGKSDRTRLNPGDHDIEIRFRSKPDGSGRFRLFWEERSFPRQSIPPAAFQSEGTADPKRLGRELFASHHCAKCHLPSAGLGASPMGEMLEIAPLLADTGGRLNEDWLAEWIASPSSIKPDTTMPALVDASTDEGRQQAADLASWLVTLKINDTPEAPEAGLAEDGGAHFHQLGCVACHTAPGGARDADRIPLDLVSRKFQPGALTAFLKKPDQWYPHIGMPDFGLADDEAESIAAWLLQESSAVKRDEPAFPAGDAARGEALARELNCGACHAGLPLDTSAVPSLEAIFEKDWSEHGCLTARENLPRFPFTDEETASLVHFSKSGSRSLGRHVPAEYASRKLTSLRCTSCHAIDEVRPLLETTHLETEELIAHLERTDEKLDQSRPHLTLAGEMLHASYLESMIDGRERARPWLEMRMPAFHAHAASLAEGLAERHGIPPGEPAAIDTDPERVSIGRQLVGTDGFGCNTCHGAGDEPPTAAFEVQGINFDQAHQRLRKEWFMRWMDHPASITPSTKMPRYSERGKSQRTDVLDGDAAAQFDAIWHYLMSESKE